MTQLWIDYKSKVLAEYVRKRENTPLSSRLIRPAPAKLRDECMAVCIERYDSKKDDKALRDFFGHFPNQKACLELIKDWKIDDFRPLVNFMNGRTTEPEDKHVELLAWLIDFQPRPFELGRRYDPDTPVISSQLTIDPPEKSAKDDLSVKADMLVSVNSGKPYNKLRFNIGIATAISVIIICMIAFFLFSGPQGCMYWTGDHYEKIDCNQKVNALTIALDSEKLMHFRKITRADTITFRSKGYVWYSKINNKLEFFTSSGNHPTEIYNTLRPISDYIIKKYCLQTQ